LVDSGGWQPLTATVSTEGGLRWAGIAALRDGIPTVRLDFAPVLAKALRLTLAAGDATYHWTVHELTLVGVN
jgi:hypothetical protein